MTPHAIPVHGVRKIIADLQRGGTGVLLHGAIHSGADSDQGRAVKDGRSEQISVQHLWMQYGAKSDAVVALADIDFTVRDGEFVSIVGPSGCGKSTLLRILAGLMPQTRGLASLAGSPIVGPRRDIGVVFQSPVLFPWRTVLANAEVPVDVQGLDRKAMRVRALELLKLVGLEGFEARYPRELSGGMQQRVSLVRALIHDPALLLMDEPFGALDAMTRETMHIELQRIWMERRKTIVFITHSIAEAVFLADRVLVMTPRPGKIGAELTVDLPRPRALDIVNTEVFGGYVRQIRAALNATGGAL